MKRVYVVCLRFHDMSPAKKFGELIPLSTVSMPRFEIGDIYEKFLEKLQHSTDEDYILLSGTSVMIAVAVSIFAAMHKRVNMLIFDPSKRGYIERVMKLSELEKA